MHEEQRKIKKILEHFGIRTLDLGGRSFTEIKNNKNNRKVFGIERIMMGRKEKKVRIIIDYDANLPVMILRVFSDDSIAEVREAGVGRDPSM